MIILIQSDLAHLNHLPLKKYCSSSLRFSKCSFRDTLLIFLLDRIGTRQASVRR